MAESKVPVKTEGKGISRSGGAGGFDPFESLHRQVDRLFEEFGRNGWLQPFGRLELDRPYWRSETQLAAAPAVDVAEKDNEYEITAELPGMDESNIEVKLANGTLTIRGEKSESKEEKKKDYHLSERRYGSFQRSFSVPEGVDAEKIEASFKNGVLSLKLPKTPAAQKAEKKIAIKSK